MGMTKRTKKRCAAQQMLVLLGRLAHKLIGWARRWLVPEQPRLRRYGIVRMVRAGLPVRGTLMVDGMGQLVRIILKRAAPFGRGFVAAFARLLAPAHIAVNLGQT